MGRGTLVTGAPPFCAPQVQYPISDDSAQERAQGTGLPGRVFDAGQPGMLHRVVRVGPVTQEAAGQGPQKAVLGQDCLHFFNIGADVRHSRRTDTGGLESGSGRVVRASELAILAPLFSRQIA